MSGCTADGVWSSGAKNSGDKFQFAFTTSGTFNYFCIPHCSMGMTGSITVSTTSGVEETSMALTSFNTFPNPNAGITNLSLNLEKAANVKLAVYDLSGKMIFENSNINGGSLNINYSLDMQTWHSGMYLAKLFIDGIPSESRMLIKQ